MRKRTNTKALKQFVLEEADKRNLSQRQVAAGIGVDHSNFSEMLNGKRSLNIHIGNRIADYLGTPRTHVYKLAGWLDLDEDEVFIENVKVYAQKNPEFKKLIQFILNLGSERECVRLISIICVALEITSTKAHNGNCRNY